jgi:hypothetical protein
MRHMACSMTFQSTSMGPVCDPFGLDLGFDLGSGIEGSAGPLSGFRFFFAIGSPRVPARHPVSPTSHCIARTDHSPGETGRAPRD